MHFKRGGCVGISLDLTSRQARTCELASEHRFAVPTPARGAVQAQRQPFGSMRALGPLGHGAFT